MALFVVGDTHLSLSVDKPMDIFSGWAGYEKILEKNWLELIKPDDTVVIAGDVSWGMTLEQSLEDFRFLDALPGRKIILKGNHDYWWTTKKKMDDFFAENGLKTLNILHNCHYACGDVAICGSRGWIFENGAEHDIKITNREAARLEASLLAAAKSGLEPIAFLHYPPLFNEQFSWPIINVMKRFGVKRCFYGHIHDAGIRYAVNGDFDGIEYRLISCDALKFKPFEVI